MKTRIFMLLLLAGSSMFAGPRVFFGVGIGYPAPVVAYAPPPPPPVYYAPRAPGPGYAWVDGYYYPVGPRWSWRAGYWTRRPFAGAYWAAPRYHRGRYWGGYWRR